MVVFGLIFSSISIGIVMGVSIVYFVEVEFINRFSSVVSKIMVISRIGVGSFDFCRVEVFVIVRMVLRLDDVNWFRNRVMVKVRMI